MVCRSFRKFIPVLPMLIAAFGMAGCVLDKSDRDEIPAPVNGEDIVITVNIHGQQAPATRSIDGYGGEAVVDVINLLVFENTGAGEVLAEHVQGTIIDQSTDKDDNYKVRFKAALTPNANAKTLAVVANAAAEVDAAVDSGATSKAAILAALIHPETAPADFYWNANNGNPASETAVAGVDYTPIPMYGEYDVTKGGTNTAGITKGMKMQGIDMVRMVARIDVVNDAAGFTLTDIYIVNFNDSGYIAPAWGLGGTGGALMPNLPSTPMVPPTAGKVTGEGGALHYSYPNGIDSLTGEIYIYEAEATTGVEGTSGHTDAVCLIVVGTIGADSTPQFYRIDFTAGTDGNDKKPGETGFDPFDVEYMPVYRNHRYTFTIGAVNGIGHKNFGEALASLGILNNLRTELLIIDESGLNNTVFNGQHYLSIGDFGGFEAEGGNANVLVTTNYGKGWAIDSIAYAGADTGWLTASKENSGDVKRAYLQLTAQPNAARYERRATVYLSAGRLRHHLEVVQGYAPISVRIFEYINGQKGDEITSLEFIANGAAQVAAQSFLVEWSPKEVALKVDTTVGGYQSPFVYLTGSGKVEPGTFTDASGTLVYTIQPGALATSSNPLYEQGFTASFAVALGLETATAELAVRHYNRNAAIVKKQTYLLDGSTDHSFTVKSNVEWTAYYVRQVVTYGVNKQFITAMGGQSVPMDSGATPIMIASGGHNLGVGGTQIMFSVIDEINRDPQPETYLGDGYILVVAGTDELGAKYFEDKSDNLFCASAVPVGESNAYMIKNTNPTPIMIPISQLKYAMIGRNGSGSGNGFLGLNWITNFNNLKAQVFWSDISPLSGSSAVVNTVIYNGGTSLEDGKIIVIPGTGAGNAGIFLYEENNNTPGYQSTGANADVIRWSWHIWKSDYFPYEEGTYPGTNPVPYIPDNDGTWMDRNLGASTNQYVSDKPFQVIGLLYQWGRKDPFPSNTAWNSTAFTDYLYYATTIASEKFRSISIGTNVAYNLMPSVSNPLTRYYGVIDWYDWFSSDNNYNHDLWGGIGNSQFLHSDGGKSVYDPCPEGYRIPKNGSSNGWPGVRSDWKPAGVYPQGYTNSNFGGYYPLGRTWYADRATLSAVENTSSYWMANGGASGNARRSYILFFNNQGNITIGDGFARANAALVRCRAE